MSTALAYSEPYKFSAGLLALVVHCAFFTLLYFGFRWQAQLPEEFMVEMWDSLPNTEVVPVPAQEPLPPPVNVEPVARPKLVAPVLPPVKAEIEVREKKNKKTEIKDKQNKKSAAKEKASAVAKAKQEAERRELDAYSNQLRKAEQERIRAEVNAATATQVGRYEDMIRSKIRRNIVMPPDVPETAKAEFRVTLLPGGMVMDAVLLKSSGSAAYDNAVERAIYKAQPLPVPAEAALQKMFRELRLTLRP